MTVLESAPNALLDGTETMGAAAPAAAPAMAVYATWAPRYRNAGFWPVPVTPGQKACHMPNWQVAMSEADFKSSLVRYADHGIGLLMGSPFADGTTLAALDVDDDRYTSVAHALLGHPPCVRRGARGVGIFVRVRGSLGYVAFKGRGETKKHSELLTRARLLVIPPTIHPATALPYTWLTRSLLDVDCSDLPILDA